MALAPLAPLISSGLVGFFLVFSHCVPKSLPLSPPLQASAGLVSLCVDSGIRQSRLPEPSESEPPPGPSCLLLISPNHPSPMSWQECLP